MKNNMKPSRYNLSWKRKDEYLVYNTLKGTFVCLNKEEMEFVNNPNMSNGIDLETIKGIKGEGLIIPKQYDEVEILKNDLYCKEYATDTLELTIAPTMMCNFACFYCFEDEENRTEKMTSDTQRLVIDFTCKLLSRVKRLHVTWFGGEPLLAQDVIDYLSKKLIEQCNECHVDYSASIVTNGFLLGNVAGKLREWKIENCQITIDGCKEYHDKRRVLRNGNGTFDQILDNIKLVKEKTLISVRMNVDKTNIDCVVDLRKYFDCNGLEDIDIFPAPVRNTKNQNYDVYYTKSEFLDVQIESLNSIGKENLMLLFPNNYSISCCADCEMAYVIDSQGDVYKCWSDIGIKEERIGDLKHGIDEYESIKYKPIEIFENEKCLKCKLLPICLGGCAFERKEMAGPQCIYNEKGLKNYLELLAESV